jgi:predicted nucleic acid-binding protein
MAVNVLIDVNVLVDFLTQRNSAVNISATNNLMLKVHQQKVNAFISPQIIHITSHLLQAHHSMSVEEIRVLWADLLTFFNVVECTEEAIDDVILSDMQNFEDSMLAYTAYHNEMDYIVTHDKKFMHHSIGDLHIVPPSTLLKLFQS